MASNRGVVYMGPGKVEVQSIDFPKLELGSRKCNHGVILKIISTNICGSDQHMVRGRTTAPQGLVLGHESQARRPGDYFTTRMGREPVVVVRKDGGEIGVLVNRCAHRGAGIPAMQEHLCLLIRCKYQRKQPTSNAI